MMGRLATIAFEQRSATTVATVSGEVDMSNADQLLERVLGEAGMAPSVVLDLSECTYLDSAGLGVIVRIEAACRDRSVHLRLVVPAGASVDRVLAMTGMSDLVTIDRTLDDAIAHTELDPDELAER